MTDQNQKNKKRKRILFAIMATVCAALVLTTSTYAWFTANRTVTVNNINVNVAAANGLQISADGLNWTTIISNDDILNVADADTGTYKTAVNQIPGGSDSATKTTNTMSPVSTLATTDAIDTSTGFLNMYSGKIEGSLLGGGLILTTEKSTEVFGRTGDFVAFDVFLQVNVATQIYLTSSSKVVTSTGKDATGIQNAARVAIIDEGNVPSGSAATDIQGLHAGKSVFLWEPNSDTHTDAAIANATNNYNVTGLKNSGSAPVNYYGVIAPIASSDNFALSATTAGKVAAVPAHYTTTATEGIPSTAYKELVNLAAGITKLRIYMWVEGQDVDCEDSASGGSLTYSLQFSSLDKAGAVTEPEVEPGS